MGDISSYESAEYRPLFWLKKKDSLAWDGWKNYIMRSEYQIRIARGVLWLGDTEGGGDLRDISSFESVERRPPFLCKGKKQSIL